MMIPVSHECKMTRQKATAVGCDETCFYGVGVPLNVLLQAFTRKEIVWYSMQYGDGDLKDNLFMVGIGPSDAVHFQNVSYDGTSPIRNAVGESCRFEEYQLSPGMQAALGIAVDKFTKTCLVEYKENILYQVYVHGDCLSCVEPVDDFLLNRLVYSVLQQHSYYLNADIDWTDIVGALAAEVGRNNSLLIKSEPSAGCLVIRREGFFPWLNELLAPAAYRAVAIENSKARFTEQFLKRLNNNPGIIH